MTAAAAEQPIPTVFHMDLSDAHPGEEYWLNAGTGRKHALLAHTAETRSKLRAAAPHLANLADAQLTHYTEPLQMPAGQVVRVHLKHTLKGFPTAKGAAGVGHSALYVPPLGKKLAAFRASGVHHQTVDYVSTAKNLVFHHPDLITKDKDLAHAIHEHMDDDKAISLMFQELGTRMRQMGQPTESSGWARLVPFTPEANPETKFDGKKTYYFQQPSDDFQVVAGPVTTAVMVATKNDARLEGKKWSVQTGTSVQAEHGPSQLALAARIRTAEAGSWRASLANKGEVHGFTVDMSVVDANKRQVKLTMTNIFIRYLGAYIRFFDAKGNAMPVPTWKPDDALIAGIITEVLDIQYPDLRFLGYLGPVNNIFAIPIASDPGKLEVTITFPQGAVSAAIYGSGLGTGANEWPKTPIVGGVMTGIFNLGVPAFMLGFQVAAQSYKPLYDIVDGLTKNPKFVKAVIGGGIVFFGGRFANGAVHGEMDWKAFSTLAELLFNQAATKALLWIEADLAAEKVAEEIPFAGWLILALNIATGIAQLAETIVEVATSPWNIQNKISTSLTTDVVLHPDPRNKAFPQSAGKPARYTVKMIYRDQSRPTVSQVHEVPAGSTATTLPASFPDNTLGGQVKLEAEYTIGNWVAAKATSGWQPNDLEHVSKVDLYLVQLPVPLDEKSVYQHGSLLTYQGGAYAWQPTKQAPAATITSRDTRSSGNAISVWSGLTLSQRSGMIGFAWKAAGMGIKSVTSGQGGQLFAMQNVNIPGTPMKSVKFPAAGFDGQTQLIYDPYPPRFKMTKDGQWELGPDGRPLPDPADKKLGNYYIDPRKAAVSLSEGGGYHLRAVTLDDSTPFDLGAELPSYGRFQFFPDSFALHPAGHVVAVSSQYGKIQIAQLPADPGPDADQRVARVAGGNAVKQERRGLMFRPIAVTCSYDGTIFVLENTKSGGNQGSAGAVSRLQAFDLYGNPVNRFFDRGGKPTPFLPLQGAESNTYLDVAAVGDAEMTYLYALYYTGKGEQPSDYHMAIYQYGRQAPNANPLVTTGGVTAAHLAVDMWHTAYTLNFAAVTDGKGNVAGPRNDSTGPGGRTVPSVSQWLPPAPG